LLQNEEGKVARELARLLPSAGAKWVAAQFDDKLALKTLVGIVAATEREALDAAASGHGVSLLKTRS
jgi:hypothetical protein